MSKVTDLTVRNKELRERFNQWRIANYNPTFRALHKAIGVGYPDLVSWSVGSKDYGINNLNKVEEFLNKKESGDVA